MELCNKCDRNEVIICGALGFIYLIDVMRALMTSYYRRNNRKKIRILPFIQSINSTCYCCCSLLLFQQMNCKIARPFSKEVFCFICDMQKRQTRTWLVGREFNRYFSSIQIGPEARIVQPKVKSKRQIEKKIVRLFISKIEINT